MPFYRRPEIPKQSDDEPGVDSPQIDFTRWLLIFVSLGIVIYILHKQHFGSVAEPPPGILVPEDPQLVLIDNAAEYKVGKYTIKPLATLNISARVLSVEYYSDDRESELAPVDFALGWGSMSDSALLHSLKIKQGGRWYTWRYHTKPPVSDDYIITHSRNVHIIPVNKFVASIVDKVRKNNVIQMNGYLVTINAPDRYNWTSHLSLDGSGAHTCLVYWVTSIKIIK